MLTHSKWFTFMTRLRLITKNFIIISLCTVLLSITRQTGRGIFDTSRLFYTVSFFSLQTLSVWHCVPSETFILPLFHRPAQRNVQVGASDTFIATCRSLVPIKFSFLLPSSSAFVATRLFVQSLSWINLLHFYVWRFWFTVKLPFSAFKAQQFNTRAFVPRRRPGKPNLNEFAIASALWWLQWLVRRVWESKRRENLLIEKVRKFIFTKTVEIRVTHSQINQTSLDNSTFKSSNIFLSVKAAFQLPSHRADVQRLTEIFKLNCCTLWSCDQNFRRTRSRWKALSAHMRRSFSPNLDLLHRRLPTDVHAKT